jgi:hypothetical protein
MSDSASLTWNGTSLSATQLDVTANGQLRLQDAAGGEYVGFKSPATLGASYTLTFPADDGTSGQALITDGSGGLSWSTAASGDVYGPASATNNALARFDGTTGKIIKDSAGLTFDGTTLSVNNGSAGSAGISITGTYSGSGTVAFLNFQRAGGAVAGTLGYNDASTAIQFGTTTNHSTIFLQNNAEAMRLTSTGLGIGTSSPTQKLQVNGTGRFYKASASTIGAVASSGLLIDGAGTNGELSQIGFGYDSALTYMPAAIYGVTTTQSGNTAMAIGFATRNVTTDTAPTERVRITQAGNVGVGTSAPLTKLDVVGTITSSNPTNTVGQTANVVLNTFNTNFGATDTATLQSVLNNTTTGENDFFIKQFNHNQGTTSDVVLKASSGDSGFVSLYTANTERMRINSSGYVGIGSSTPTFKLVVQGTANTVGSEVLITATGVASGYLGSNANGLNIGTDTAGLVFKTGVAGSVGATGTERARIDSSGNFLLGGTVAANSTGGMTITVGAASTVSTPLALRNPSTGSGAGTQISFRGSSSTGSEYDYAYLTMVADNTASGLGSMRFSTSSGSSPVERARIDSSGNFGIGTSSPSYKFDVVANAATTWAARIYNSNGYQGLLVNTSTTSSGILNFGCYNGASYLFAVCDNGAVGVGTTTPTTYGGFAVRKAFTTSDTTNCSASFSDAANSTFDIGHTANLVTLNAQGSALAFNAGSSERVRIDTVGNLVVGASSGYDGTYRGIQAINTTGGDCAVFTSTGASGTIVRWNKATSGDNRFIDFYTETSITIRGSITYNRAGGLTAYNVTSDYRAKDIIGPVTNSGALIDSVPVYMGKMKDATQERPMFLAHETPNYAHTGEKDAVDKDGKPVYQQMDASALIPVMWAEIQSLRKRLADAGIA